MLKNNPLISVYITNHNYGKYIKKAIDSVLGQTYKNFELIIIDDGSKDNSKSIIKRYINKKKIIFVFQKKKGLTVSNNIALRLSKGKYIIRLDADDWLDFNALQIMVNYLEKHPGVALVFPDYYEVDNKGNILNLVRRHNFKKVKLLDKPAHGACTMIRKECIQKIGGYNEKFDRQDGYYIWFKFIQRYEVKNINLPLFYYRQHSLSLTRNEKKILRTRADIIRATSFRSSSNKKALAILPVRGRDINSHNIFLKKLRGKPLGCWIIDALLKSKKISKILVTSPDSRIINYLKRKYKNKILLVKRDPKLAGINVALNETLDKSIKYALNKKIKFNYVFQLNYRTPFLTTDDLNSFVYLIEFFKTDEVLGVKLENDRIYKHNGNSLLLLNKDSDLKLERDEIYRGVAGLRLFKKNIFKKGNTNIIKGHYVLDQRSSHVINTDLDWKIATVI